ncbi:GDP-L-fucose synthase [Limimaricola soesokkakensis]|uniref:GDP-L-fucose synthase n=1 Tax=Limimaricola soesokkakensis TaxID=1343159 RepID=A0A1X7A7K1_9RHOB|nr:GDP-L-fucose synthase [Limimaricola soesokkakensis]SLN72208.1 GDP-L-fucose synthase [Limimaricola soesokkakensis]
MAKIFIAGHRGMVGSAILRRLAARGCDELVTRTSDQLDLCDQGAVREFMQNERPDAVVLAAAKVGGIYANNVYPADFIHDNLMIQTNVIGQAHAAGVQRLLFLGSSCIYPCEAELPISEEALLTGRLAATNEPYAVAKIAGIKTCESFNRQYGRDYRSVMPTNLYGPRDNFHPENSHVMPALIRRFHEARECGASSVTVWGSGRPRREFLHVDDMADASIFLLGLDRHFYESKTKPMMSHINVGSGSEISIGDLARLIAEITGFQGCIEFDTSMPDGTFSKLMNSRRLHELGWQPKVRLEDGIRATYCWYLEKIKSRTSAPRG